MDLRRLALALCLALVACDPAGATPDGGSPSSDAAPAPSRDAGPPPEDLDGFIEWHMAAGGIPGLAAAIVDVAGPRWVGTYGYADIEAERPVDEHTLFVMASISKTLTAARAMQLVEEGRLDLDEPVETYLSYPVRHPDHPDVPITARMLLTHTSGIADNFALLAEVTTTGDPTVSLGAFSEGYVTEGGAYYDADTNWGFTPGTRRVYSNAAFGVLGHVLEEAAGAPFDQQTEASLFAPLAMDGAGWFLSDVDPSRLATPYGWGGRRFNPLPHNGASFYPATTLRVSVTGLGRFASSVMAGGELDGTRVLESDSVAEMLRIQHPRIDGGQALGFIERRVDGNVYVGHGGSTFGGSTQLLLAREGGFALVLLTNSDAYVRERFGLREGDDAMDAILSRLDEEARR